MLNKNDEVQFKEYKKDKYEELISILTGPYGIKYRKAHVRGPKSITNPYTDKIGVGSEIRIPWNEEFCRSLKYQN